MIADGDRRKLEIMLEFHGDVDVFGMRQEILQLSRDEEYEQSTKTEKYQQPQKPGIVTITNNKLDAVATILALPMKSPQCVFFIFIRQMAPHRFSERSTS